MDRLGNVKLLLRRRHLRSEGVDVAITRSSTVKPRNPLGLYVTNIRQQRAAY
ncbi:hypothetical protein OIDMADRAFT_21518 [Oidiodendron maius Zn]|uniref:Uncharacterized protein n=1 Tax=Oidiodendron maius (strain Zn) TaxID=913774 RepID=A0A0C3CUR6_OIDMZ|nr:hypothetical protein OIDMADRAFT_21518 [Oidiodendron maius Zn]